MKKQAEKENKKPYVWVKDATGSEFLCPADALKDVRGENDKELEDCINVAALKPYVEDV
jgi:hypothetical protein